MNEQDRKKHNRTKLILKILGLLLLATGITFVVIGFVDVFGSFGDGMPSKFWCFFVGFPVIFVGASMSVLGFRGEIHRYVKNESAPIFNEMSMDIQPGIQNIASATKDGLIGSVRCECGEVNAAGSKFCNNCGKPLSAACPGCGEEIPAGAKFCNNCGKKL